MADGRGLAGRGWVAPLVSALGLTALGLAAAWAWSAGNDLEPGFLTRDPSSVADLRWYVGAASTIGLCIWAAGATAALLAGGMARRHRRPEAGLLLAAGVFTAVVALDDAFVFHESIAPDDLGVPQRAVYGVYAVLLTAGLVRFRHTLAVMEWPVALIAGGLFAASLAVDAYESRKPALLDDPATFFAEDGLKLLGIVAWACFLVRAAYLVLDDLTSAHRSG
jgi:hypothetical protein